MKSRHWIVWGAGLMALGIFTARVEAIELGEPAPALHIDHWVQREPIDLKATRGKQIVVIEFWATWCGPCRTSIPHLSALQKEFADRDVRILGVTDEKISVVKPFLKRMGTNMSYTVAIDRQQKTYANYMEAFGIDGIPHAFVVGKEGTLLWQGHPMAGLKEALERILAGTYDLTAAKEAARASQLIPRYLAMIKAETPNTEAPQVGREIVDHHRSDADFLNDFAWFILTDDSVQHRDLALAKAAARQAYENTEGRSVDVMDTYARALFEFGDIKQAVVIQEKALATNEDPEEGSRLQKALTRYRQKLEEGD